MNETFTTNLLSDSKVSGAGADQAAALLDTNYSTYWTTPGRDTTATLSFALPKPQRFDLLQLQENSTLGQRIESFVLEYKSGAEWKTAVAGTTVGYKRILRFEPVRAQYVRLRITSSRLNPTLSAIGLYKQAAAVASNQ
ncbi:MAG: discoidin domain-containing protein [Hymenobacter sp.]|nr:MAG: discoidin domain-containing protein [Hymenobacter sp.]